MSETEIIQKLMSNAKSRGGKSQNRTYVISKDGDMTKKLAPQAVTVLKIMFETGKDTISESDLQEVFAKSELKTKQDKFRIFQYYRKPLVDAGWIRVEKTSK